MFAIQVTVYPTWEFVGGGGLRSFGWFVVRAKGRTVSGIQVQGAFQGCEMKGVNMEGAPLNI